MTNNKITILYVSALLLVLVASLLVSSYLFIQSLKQEVTQLEQQLQELQLQQASEDSDNTGGAEVDFAEELVKQSQFMFPIHEADFKYFTSPFGIRVSPFLNIEMRHLGVDIASAWRAQIVAIADGVVAEHYPVPGTLHPEGYQFKGHPIYGGMIRIKHDNGFESLYAHLSYSRVHTGKRVKAGEIIGRVGGTGKSVGEHLHLELHKDGIPVNPLLYIPSF